MAVGELAPAGIDGRDRAAFDDGDAHAPGGYSLRPIGPERIDIAAAGRLDRDAFAARFGGVFEASPWIAAGAWAARPFESVDALHGALVDVVARAPREARIALIRAHPDLAGKAAIAGELTPESTREQAAAGLDRLTPAQHERIIGLTAAYRERFGFPFVVCAREHTADSIIATAEQRLAADPDEEEGAALSEIAKIARLRLDDLVACRATVDPK